MQNTSDLHDCVRNTNPKVDENNGNPCPCSVLEEWQWGMNPSRRDEKTVNSAISLQHAVHNKQRHKLWNCDCKREADAPQALKASSAPVNNHCHKHAKEEVQECSEEGPNKGPNQNIEEDSSINGSSCVSKNLNKVV